MKRTQTIVREIGQTQARIAALCEDHARIGQEILVLEATQKTRFMCLVSDAVERFDFTRVRMDHLLSLVSKLGDDMGELVTSKPETAPTIAALVRLTRNTSEINRLFLTANGLGWNGRRRGWTGRVTEGQLEQLRRRFGERLEEPASVGAGEDPGSSQEHFVVGLSADVEPVMAPATGHPEAQGPDDPNSTVEPVVSVGPTMHFRGLPRRRPES